MKASEASAKGERQATNSTNHLKFAGAGKMKMKIKIKAWHQQNAVMPETIHNKQRMMRCLCWQQQLTNKTVIMKIYHNNNHIFI